MEYSTLDEKLSRDVAVRLIPPVLSDPYLLTHTALALLLLLYLFVSHHIHTSHMIYLRDAIILITSERRQHIPASLRKPTLLLELLMSSFNDIALYCSVIE